MKRSRTCLPPVGDIVQIRRALHAGASREGPRVRCRFPQPRAGWACRARRRSTICFGMRRSSTHGRRGYSILPEFANVNVGAVSIEDRAVQSRHFGAQVAAGQEDHSRRARSVRHGGGKRGDMLPNASAGRCRMWMRAVSSWHRICGLKYLPRDVAFGKMKAIGPTAPRSWRRNCPEARPSRQRKSGGGCCRLPFHRFRCATESSCHFPAAAVRKRAEILIRRGEEKASASIWSAMTFGLGQERHCRHRSAALSGFAGSADSRRAPEARAAQTRNNLIHRLVGVTKEPPRQFRRRYAVACVHDASARCTECRSGRWRAGPVFQATAHKRGWPDSRGYMVLGRADPLRRDRVALDNIRVLLYWGP